MKKQGKRKSYGGRVLSSLLVLCLLFGMLPTAALAVNSEPEGEAVVECTQDEGCAAETHDESCPLYGAPAPEEESADKDALIPAEPTATEQVAAMVKALPEYADATPDDVADIEAAQAAYDALTVEEQAAVDAELVSKLADLAELAEDLKNYEPSNDASVYDVQPVVSGNCGATAGDNVTWALAQNNADNENPTYTLTISGTGAMVDYARVGTTGDVSNAPWYEMGKTDGNITKLVIEPGITRIGAHAFRGCVSVKDLTLPDTLQTIGDAAFKGSGVSGTLVIPNGVTNMGTYTFAGCTGLTNLELRNSPNEIGDGLFSGCTNLTGTFSIPSSVSKIGAYSFYQNKFSETLVLPDALTTIGDNAFSYTTFSGGVVIPGTVSAIGTQAFYNCSALTDIYIASTNITFGNTGVFQGLSDNSFVYVNSDAVKETLKNLYTNTKTTIAVTNGGTFADSTEFASGTLSTPVKDGCVFAGWYTQDGTNGGDWGDKVNAPTAGQTYYAKWVERGGVTGTGTEQSPYVLSDGAHIYALARILAKQPSSDGDAILTDQLKADYLLLGYLSGYKEAYAAIQRAYYQLDADIALSNYSEENYNGFCGIPNFCGGSFDGKNHTITLAMDFSKYPAETKFIGGVFANAKDAAIKNLKLAGEAAGTLSSTAGLTDVGLLIGATENGTQPTTLENITAAAAIDMTMDLGVSQCAYVAAMVGRGYSVTMTNCVNRGDFTAVSNNPTTNAPRIAGLVGHAYTGFQLERCANEGRITTTGSGPLTTGDFVGSASSPVYKNCVSSGSVSSQAGALSVFGGMRTDCAKADGNVIRVTITGKAGHRVVNADAGINYTYSEDGDQLFDLPVYYDQDGVRNYSKYMQNEHFAVNGDSRLFLFDLRNTSFTTKLNTADAFAEALPFSSWATALPISTAEHLLWMQKAINDGDETAIQALYALGGRSVENLNLETARIVLRSAYYKLQNDVTVTGGTGFTGIGDTDSFGGHFDGGGHTVTLTITETLSEQTENKYFGLFGYMVPLTDGMVEVRNLNVVSSFDLTLPMDTSYSAYVGGLSGYVSGVTLDNVNVTLKKMDLTKKGDQGTGSQGGVNAGGCFGGEFSWQGACPTVKIDCTITADWPVAEPNKKVGSLNAGGFAGHGQYGGSVEFISGAGIDANNIPSPRIGGIMGYSWSPNVLDGFSVKNSSGHAITMSGATAQIGMLIGYHTSASAAADAVSLSADGVIVEGAFVLKGMYAGGLFGNVDTSGIVNIANCVLSDEIEVLYAVENRFYGGLIGYAYLRSASLQLRDTAVGVKVPNEGIYTGALIGYMTKGGGIEAQNSAYVTRSSEAAVGQRQGPPNAPVLTIDGAAVLDSTVLAGAQSFGGTVQLTDSIPAPASMTIAPSDAFTLSSGVVTFTKVGSAQKAALKWNGRTFYTSGEITVDPKELADDDVTITGVNSVYASDQAAAAALDSIAVVHEGKALVRGTDYTVEQITSNGSHKFTVAFAGNYSGAAEVSYTVSDAALTASAQGYTGVYDAAGHTITVTAPEDATVIYGEESGNLEETNPEYTNAGTYVVYWKAAKGDSEVTGSEVVIITPATLTIKAENKYIYVGDALPSYTYTVSGWQGEDNESLLTPPPAATCPTANANTAGDYTITVTGPASIDNYTITYEPGILTVSRRSSGGGGGGSSSTSGVSGSGGSVSVSAGGGTVSNSQMTAAVNKASEGTTIDIKATDSTAVTLPVSGMKGAAANDNHVTVITRSGEVTLSAAAIEGLVEGASSNETIRVSVTTAVSSAAGVEAGTPVFNVSVSVGGRIVHSFDGALTITLIVPNLSKIENPHVLHILTDGTKQYLKPRVSGNRLTVSGIRNLSYFAVIPGSQVPRELPFTDVAEGFWAYEGISYAYEKGLFAGTSETTFSPDVTMTREMLWTVLSRLSGAELDGENVFQQARQWAMTSGVSDGTNGGSTITREQMVTMLYSYAGHPAAGGDLSGYADVSSVSGYAADAMAWAVESEIISGTSGATLSPQGSATRAQVATILMRFIERADQ